MPDWTLPLLPLLGVLVAQFGSTRLDSARWRREWLAAQVSSRREHYVELLDALHDQHIVLHHIADGRELPRDRIDAVTANWRKQFTRSLLGASDDVQLAVGAYDRARGAFVTAANACDVTTAVARMADLDTMRKAIVLRINEDLHDFNAALTPHVLTRWQRLTGVKPPANELSAADANDPGGSSSE